MLKRNLLKTAWLVVMLATTSVVFGNEKAQQAFEKGNVFYKNQNYAAALSIYDSLLKAGFRSAALEYNAGSAFYRTGQIAKSILHYERAALLKPNDPDTEHNLKMAYLSTVDKIDPEPVLFYQQWWRDFAYGGTLEAKSKWTAILLWLSLGFWAAYLFLSKIAIRKWSFYACCFTLIFGLLGWALTEHHSNHMHENKGAIIMTDAAYVKGAPTKDGANLFMLHSGTKVTVVDELDAWKKIRLANGNEGWIEKGEIEEI